MPGSVSPVSSVGSGSVVDVVADASGLVVLVVVLDPFVGSEVAFEARFGADEEACVAQVGPDPAREDAWEAAVESGVVAYDVAAAKACVEALEGTGCEALFAEPPAEPCRSVTTGSLALDEACTLDAECESGLCLEERCAGPMDDDDDSEGA